MKIISRLALLAPLLAALLCALPREARAATFRPAGASVPAGSVPSTINYQGRLVDNGFPVNATRTITFRLYDNLLAGTLLYTVPSQQVVVSQGVFGCTLAISTSALASPAQKFLEVQIDSTILSPREPLNSVPYALVAKSLEDNLDISTVSVATQLISSGTLSVASIQALNGSSYFSIVSPVHMSSSTLILDGNAATSLTTVGKVGIGTGAPGQLLTLNGGGSDTHALLQNTFTGAGLANGLDLIETTGGAGQLWNYQNGPLQFATNGTEQVRIDALGSVGIGAGAFAPGAKLDVDGSAQFGSAGTKSVFAAGGTLTIANNASLILSGSAGTVNTGSSVTASGLFANALAIGTPNPATKMHMSSGTLTIDGVGAAVTVSGPVTATNFSGGVSGNATSATNLAGGTANKVPYQTGAGATTFSNTPPANSVINVTGGVPTWTNTPTFNGSLVTALTAANISAGTAGINITGNAGGTAANVTTNANLTGNVTSIGNATTLASIPAISGAALTNLDPTHISAGTAGINITGNAGGTAANVTTNANLTGNVTSVGNATTIAVIPAVSGAALTNLDSTHITAGTAGINITGNAGGTAANVTTNANLTGNVTSVGNATTIAVIPAVSGASLTNLTAANISAGTAGISITGNAATAHAANGGESLSSQSKAALSAVVPALGQIFFCNNCAPPKVVVATGTAAGNFADVMGGNFQ